MSSKKRNSCRGFTLVELSLSMALIAMLSLIIVLLISNMMSSYRRGLILNQINTTGMDIVDDMRTSVQRSSSKDAENVDVVRKGEVNIGTGENIPVAGAFCTGTYSYIWNSGYFFAGKVRSGNRLSFGGDNNFKLLKVKDRLRAICAELIEDENKYNIGYTIVDSDEEAIDLLSSNDLALYDLSVFKALPEDEESKDSFYAVSFILGTVQGGINVTAAGNFCAAPNDYGNDQNFDYCSINKFNFAARATGKAGEAR